MATFEWDPVKARDNLHKHHVGFPEAQSVFADPLSVSRPDPDHSETEERWLTIGISLLGRLLVVSHTRIIEGDEEVIRLISARQATKHERKSYEEEAE